MIRGTARGSLRTSTTSPASTATSVPAPMAMPTSAATRAGASFTPSPTIATRCPSRRSASMVSRLLLRENLGMDVVDPEFLPHGLSHGPGIPGQHRHPDACGVQGANRLGGLGAHGVGHRERRARGPVGDQVDDGLTSPGRLLREPRKVGWHLGVDPLQEVRPAYHPLPALHRGSHAPPRNGGEGGGCRDREAPVGRRADDRARHGVLRVSLHRGGDPDSVFLGDALDDAGADDPVLTERQRPRLVEDHLVEPASLLESTPVAHEKPGTGRDASSRSR